MPAPRTKINGMVAVPRARRVLATGLAVGCLFLAGAVVSPGYVLAGELDSMGEMGELGDPGELEALMSDLSISAGQGAGSGTGIEGLEAFLASSDLDAAVGAEQAAELRKMYATKDLNGLAQLLTSPDTQELRQSIESGELQKAVASGDISQLQGLLGDLSAAGAADAPVEASDPVDSADSASQATDSVDDLGAELAAVEAAPVTNVDGEISAEFTRVADTMTMMIG